jgi:hypothetical protein
MKIWEWIRIFIDYAIGMTISNQFIPSHDITRYPITNTCFLRIIKYDIKYTHNILIIQGGIHHFNNQTPHYIKLFASFPINSNIYHLERSDACANVQACCADIDIAITYINTHFNKSKHVGRNDDHHSINISNINNDSNNINNDSNNINNDSNNINNDSNNINNDSNNINNNNYPLTVIGFSMGGVCVLSYIAGLKQYNKDINYITVSSPLCLKQLFKTVNKETMFKHLYKTQLKQYAVSDIQQLCQRYHTTVDDVINEYYTRLKSLNIHHNNLICIIGDQDTITRNIKHDIKQLNFQYQIVDVQHATHCCDLCIYTLYKIVHKHVDSQLPLTTIVKGI